MRISPVTSFILVATLCLGVSLSASAQTAACPVRPGDKAAVADTLRGMYAAVTARDIQKLDSYFAPGFYMFDNGQRFESDSIMKTIDSLYDKGYVFVWTVTQPDVHIDCNHAWIAYVNQGSIRIKDGPVHPTTWLESANLERIHGAWKLVFFQSTRVPEPAPPASR